jgi:NADH-quinone oxidoreductase subunit N
MVFSDYIQLDFLGLFLEIYLFIVSVLLLMFGVFFVSLRQYNYNNFVREFQYILLLIFSFGILLLLNTPVTNLIIFNNLLIIDPIILSIKCILLFTTICCILVSFNYLKNEKVVLFEYNILILLSILGLLCFVSSNDLVSFYLALKHIYNQ